VYITKGGEPGKETKKAETQYETLCTESSQKYGNRSNPLRSKVGNFVGALPEKSQNRTTKWGGRRNPRKKARATPAGGKIAAGKEDESQEAE